MPGLEHLGASAPTTLIREGCANLRLEHGRCEAGVEAEIGQKEALSCEDCFYSLTHHNIVTLLCHLEFATSYFPQDIDLP